MVKVFNPLIVIVFLSILSCSGIVSNKSGKMTEASILQEFDMAFQGRKSR